MRQVLVSHHNKRNAIRERPLLIPSLVVELRPSAKEIPRGEHNLESIVPVELLQQWQQCGTIFGLGQVVAKFHEHPIRGDDATFEATDELDGG